jgi:hypothetical protein
MISSALYRFRAMPLPFVGWNSNSRLDLGYRGQVNLAAASVTFDEMSVRLSLNLQLVPYMDTLWRTGVTCVRYPC